MSKKRAKVTCSACGKKGHRKGSVKCKKPVALTAKKTPEKQIRAEVKADRFRRIAPKRTGKVINALHLLGKCANRSSYSYDVKEVKQMIDAIEEELTVVKGLFRGKKKFSFK